LLALTTPVVFGSQERPLCGLTLMAAVAVLLGGATRVRAQAVAHDSTAVAAASVGGVIVNGRTHLPVFGASVRIDGFPRFATTGPDGRFLLDEVEPGERRLVISIGGRATEPQAVALVPGRHTEIRIVMEVPEDDRSSDRAVRLPPLEIDITRTDHPGKLRGYFQRLISGRGRFITREDIERFSPTRITDLLRTVLGIRVHDERPGGEYVSSNRGCILPVFLDGLPVIGMSPNDIPAQEIEGIEIYRSTTETPSRFRGFEGCGALVIWTRDPLDG